MTQPPDPFAPPPLPPSGPMPPPVQPGWGPPPAQPGWGGEQPYGQWPAQPPWGTPAKTNVCAVLSLVFSFFCFPAAVVLGIVALVQLKRSQDTGRGLAVAGLVISGLWVVLGGLVVALVLAGVFDATPVTTGSVSRAGTTQVGQCMLSEPDAAQSLVVSCDEAHDQEVYAVGQLPSGDYPGHNAVVDSADAICAGAFPSYVGSDLDHTTLYYDYYVPSELEWSSSEERRVVCVVTPDVDGQEHRSAYHTGS